MEAVAVLCRTGGRVLLAAEGACRRLVLGDVCAYCGAGDPTLMCEPCQSFYCNKTCLTTHRKQGNHKAECERRQLEAKEWLHAAVWGGTGLALASFFLRVSWAMLYADPGGGGYSLTAQLLLCGLGFNYAMAFHSMRGQVLGLVGTKGILPCSAELSALRVACDAGDAAAEAAAQAAAATAPAPAPATHIFNALTRAQLRRHLDCMLLHTIEPALSGDPETADRFLVRLCNAGVVGGGLLIVAQLRSCSAVLQPLQLPLMLGLWWGYYAIKRLTTSFTNLQWDMLLLESGAISLPLAIPFVPRRMLVVLLFPITVLLIKLMFSSGAVKRRSKCPKWAGLTALCYHYETQPLPHGLAWWFHSFPRTAHRISCFAALMIEGPVCCLLAFGTASCRAVAFAGFAGLMSLIAASGNFGFFNYCTVTLSLVLLNDEQIVQILPRVGGVQVQQLFHRIDIATDISLGSACTTAVLASIIVVVVHATCTCRNQYRDGLERHREQHKQQQPEQQQHQQHQQHGQQSYKQTRSKLSVCMAVALIGWGGIWLGLGVLHYYIPPSQARAVPQPLHDGAFFASSSLACFLIETCLVVGTTMVIIIVVVPVLVVVVSCPLFQLGQSRRSTEKSLSPLVESLHNVLLELFVGSNYNLMARMTTVRGEIVLLGSADGVEWKEYTWKCKPGGNIHARSGLWPQSRPVQGESAVAFNAFPLSLPPHFALLSWLVVAVLLLHGLGHAVPLPLLAQLADFAIPARLPLEALGLGHVPLALLAVPLLAFPLLELGNIPRLDWRLANKRMPIGLVTGGRAPEWFDKFVARILSGSDDVLALLGPDPFDDGSGGGVAPNFVKVQIYDYRFVGTTNADEHFMPGHGDPDWEHGTLWQRRFVKTFKTYERMP